MSRSGPERVASLLLTLDRGTSAELLKRLPEHEKRAVTQALGRMGDSFLDRTTQDSLLRDFHQRLSAFDGVAMDQNDIQGLLAAALGREGETLSHQITAEGRNGRALASLQRLDAPSLAFVLEDEHPQAVAVALLELGPEAASATLPRFTQERQKDVVARMVSMRRPTGEVVTLLLEAAVAKAQRLEDVGGTQPEGEKLKAVATLLNKFSEESRQAIMVELEAADPERAQLVKDQMFTFDDLVKLGPRDVQRVLAGTDTKVLATALKGASPAVAEFLLANISKRTQERVEEERETMGAVRLSEVQKAQLEMATVTRDLIQRGEIQFGGGDDELVS